MKKLFFNIIILVAGISVTGQQLVQKDYSTATKNKKTMATILTVGGAAMILGGIISYESESSTSYYPGKTVGTILIVAGAAAVTGGILLFSSAKKNHTNNDKNTAIYLELENALRYNSNYVVKGYFPAIAVHLRLK